MGKNIKRIYISIGIAFVIFTVVSFVLPFEHGPVFWVAYLFGLISIGVQAYAIPKAFAEGSSVKSKFYGFPIARISIMYLIAQVILSLIFMAMAMIPSGWILRIEIVIFIVLLGAAMAGVLATESIREEVERQDIQLKKDVTRMRALQSQTTSLMNQCTDADTKATLERLADSFRFSDPVSSDATIAIEEELSVYVDEMQTALLEGDYSNINSLCEKVMPVLTRRNQLCKQNK